ncbi:MAG: saccharopine dehydrogenase NADP-binding domain-containing protein [Planctomycetes bacterium]|nr:saccharopine dehydrogenase NADP-binding domain-containing protein [Planctomycetota bacterium]
MKKTVVLGGGLIGAAMARDLAADPAYSVTVADLSQERLDRLARVPNLAALRADLSDPDRIRELAGGADLVLGALPSALGFRALAAVIETATPYSDISFMPEDALELDSLARERGTVAVVDCGVAPGISNLFVGASSARLDRVERVEIYVGGLPRARRWPYQYKAPFAPSDVIEEYTRPSRLVEAGRIVTRPALSEPELLDFPEVGTLEAFNTDGLRSLVRTIPAPWMKEKTLRYPGHVELMRILRETGFFRKDEIEVRGARVRPLDVTSRLLFPLWTYEEGEEEFTILRVLVEGERGGKRVRHHLDLLDRTDRASGETSMARTTAYPATLVARMLAAGRFTRPGVHPPEVLGREPGLADEVLLALRKRGIDIRTKVEESP